MSALSAASQRWRDPACRECSKSAPRNSDKQEARWRSGAGNLAVAVPDGILTPSEPRAPTWMHGQGMIERRARHRELLPTSACSGAGVRPPGPRAPARVPGGQQLAAAFADAALADGAAALLVDDQPPRALGVGGVAVAPVEQGDQGRPEVEALLGQEVLVAGRAFLVGAALEDLLVDQPLQPARRGRCGRCRATPASRRSGGCRASPSGRSAATSARRSPPGPWPPSSRGRGNRGAARVIFAHWVASSN